MTILCKPLDGSAQIKPESVLIERVDGFPSDEAGIEKGVSACFAGTFNDKLLIAGGCNFPEIPAAEGGKKRYYQGIYSAQITEQNQLDWKQIGCLPEACAYGVSVQLADGLLCIGGNNQEKSFSKVFKISVESGAAKIENYPDLPVPMDNFTGCSNGKEVAVFNGEHLFVLDLAKKALGWQELPLSKKQKLGQPVSGYIGGKFHIWGGSTAKTAERDATLQLQGIRFCRTESTVPAPRNDANEEIFLGGAAAINLSDSLLLVLGGVNKDVFLAAVNHPRPGYMTHEVSWYRFNPFINVYDGKVWRLLGKSQITARAGAALAKYKDNIYIIGGELKPGIRTPDIYKIAFCSE